MRHYFGLLLFGIAACSQPSSEGVDPGPGPQDPRMAINPFAEATINLIAGQPGGSDRHGPSLQDVGPPA